MKTLSLTVCSMVLVQVLTIGLHAQEAEPSIIRLGPDSSRVEWTTSHFDETLGDLIVETNGYTQLGTGINHWSEDSQDWEPSIEEITLHPGGAAALRSSHKVFFAPTLDHPEGSIDYLGADGSRFRSSLLALTYFDPITGQRVTFGLVRDVPGELLPPNRVIYRDAFDSVDPELTVHADVVYTFRLSGLEQDIILREFPPAPEIFGISSEVARMEVLTEFFEAPEPERHARIMASVDDEQLRARVAEPEWIDERLDFGDTVIGAGRAFRLDLDAALPPSEPEALSVGKRWVHVEGRKVLIETIDFLEALPQLLDLPGGREAAIRQGLPEVMQAGPMVRPWTERLLAQMSDPTPAQVAKTGPGFPSRPILAVTTATGSLPPMLLSSTALDATPGFVIDYVTMAVNSTNFTFRGNETYFVNNTVNLSGTTTLEGGAVVKYAKYLGSGSPTPEIKILGPFVSATSLYRPAVFTAVDDQSVGQYIPGSAAMPTNSYYVLHGLWFQNTGDVVTLENVRFRHGWHPVIFWNCHGILRNSQFQYCANPVYASSAIQLIIHNMLAVDGVAGSAPFKAYYGAQIHAEHVTVANASSLINKDGTSQVTLVNCLLAGVGTFQDYIGRNNPAYGNFESSTTAGLFQTVGAGSYYFAPDSPHRNAGVTAIDGLLAANLATLTTDPPLLLTQDVLNDTTLIPQARRDNDLPDRGYHYPPLDYCLSSINLTNATLLLTNGVAVGVYGPKGITLRSNSRLLSVGSPNQLNRLVRYHTVQEGTTNWGSAPTNSFNILDVNSGGATPTSTIDLRFTEINHLAATARGFLGAGADSDGGTVALSHCQLGGVSLVVSYAVNYHQTVTLTNNVFDGCVLSFTDIAAYGTYALSAYNNLFHRGSLSLNNQHSGSVWTLKDNLFTSDSATLANGYSTYYYNITHNGFRSGLTALGTTPKTNLTLDFQTGPLGRFYYPTSGISSSLTNLVNTGSRNATNAGLYHFTVRPDQIKETNTVVDIGHHYVAGPQAGVRFIGTDTITSGNWLGIHGLDGHLVINAATNLPANVTVTPSGHGPHTWALTTSDTRALWRPDGSSRIAACWYSGTQFDLALSVPHYPAYRLAFYVLDWNTARVDHIAARNTTTGQNLDIRGVDLFTGGKYMVYDVAGQVTFRFTNMGAINAVLSGVFFSHGRFFAADLDNDGHPDYLEDANGNGAVDGVESNWLQYTGNLPSVAGLSVYTTLQ